MIVDVLTPPLPDDDPPLSAPAEGEGEVEEAGTNEVYIIVVTWPLMVLTPVLSTCELDSVGGEDCVGGGEPLFVEAGVVGGLAVFVGGDEFALEFAGCDVGFAGLDAPPVGVELSVGVVGGDDVVAVSAVLHLRTSDG